MNTSPVILSVVALMTFATVLPLPFASGSVVDVRETLDNADRLFSQRDYDKARKLLERAAEQYPGNAGVLWRLCNHMINDGDGSTADSEKEALYRKAVQYAERAVKADPSDANAHAYLAAAYGSVAMFAGGKEKVQLANRIRDALDVALKLDKRNQVAHTIYGTWHREVAEVSWVERKLANMFLGSMPDGSLDQSMRHFRQAIAEGPDVLRHRYELGLTYIAADRDKDAAASFRAALKCPDGWKTDPIRRAHMREWLRDNA